MPTDSNNNFLDPEQILKNTFEVQAGDKIADLGCGGAAHFSFAAAKLVTTTGQIHATDVLKKALTAVDGRAKIDQVNNITTYWTDLERYGALKINDESLDKVLLVNILFQATDKATVVKEAARLLKPAGKLLIIDWLPGRFNIGPRAEDKISAAEASQLATQANLTLLQEFTASKYHFGFIYQK